MGVKGKTTNVQKKVRTKNAHKFFEKLIKIRATVKNS